MAFDFKIKSRSRGRKSIAVLSDIGGYRCCSIRNAMFSVMIGNQILFSSVIIQNLLEKFVIIQNLLEKLSLKDFNRKKEFDLRLAEIDFVNIWTNEGKT